jgi:hypothetical protein
MGLALLVRNEDASATLRASITDITGRGDTDLPSSVMTPSGFPWELGWGSDAGQRDAHVVRGETARLPLVRFDHAAAAQLFGGHRRQVGNPYIFVFPGPAGDHYLDEMKPEANSVFIVHVRLIRRDPEGVRDEAVALQFPQQAGTWRTSFVPGG